MWTLTGCHPRQQSKDGRVPFGPLCPWRGAECVGGGPFSTSVTAYGALLFFLESRTSVHLVQVASSMWPQPPEESAPLLSGASGAHFTNVILVDTERARTGNRITR